MGASNKTVGGYTHERHVYLRAMASQGEASVVYVGAAVGCDDSLTVASSKDHADFGYINSISSRNLICSRVISFYYLLSYSQSTVIACHCAKKLITNDRKKLVNDLQLT